MINGRNSHGGIQPCACDTCVAWDAHQAREHAARVAANHADRQKEADHKAAFEKRENARRAIRQKYGITPTVPHVKPEDDQAFRAEMWRADHDYLAAVDPLAAKYHARGQR